MDDVQDAESDLDQGADNLVKDWPPQYTFLTKEFLIRNVCMSGPTCLFESPFSEVDPLIDLFVHGTTIYLHIQFF